MVIKRLQRIGEGQWAQDNNTDQRLGHIRSGSLHGLNPPDCKIAVVLFTLCSKHDRQVHNITQRQLCSKQLTSWVMLYYTIKAVGV